jgi:hypothetical protein
MRTKKPAHRLLFCLLTTLLAFTLSGCDETSRHNDDRTGASVEIIDRVTIGSVARTRLKLSLGDNASGYVSASINGLSLFYPEYVTANQIDNYNKHLVCDVTLSGGASLTMRCGWTQYNPIIGDMDGALSGDWGSSILTTASIGDTLHVIVTISDRKEGDLSLYIDGSGYLY